jgi:hypothetical protein
MKKPLLILMLASFVMMSATHTASAQKLKATLAGMSGGEITAKQLSSDSVLTTESGCVIISFHLTLYGKYQNSPKEFDGNSARITEEMRKAISYSRTGTKIYFEYIKAINEKGDTLMVEPMAFVIK